MGQPSVEYLADHSLLIALPAFAPAFIVVGVVLYIAVRNRRSGNDDDESDTVDDVTNPGSQ